jgi:hypothetical protein
MQTLSAKPGTVALCTAALLAAASSVSWASAADSPKDLFAKVAPAWTVRPEQRNAALIYLSSELARVDRAALAIADVGDKLANPLGETLDASKLPKDFEAARAAINPDLVKKIRSATELARCDFEIEYEKGYKATMPSLQNMRNAARVLRVDTRIALTEPHGEGNDERAAQNLAAMYRVARDTAAMRTTISSLVAQRVIELAICETRVYLKSPLATPEGRESVLAAIQELGPDPLQQMAAMETEEIMLTSFLREHAGAKDPGASLAQALIDMANAPDSDLVKNSRRATRTELHAAIVQASELFERVRVEWSRPVAEQSSESIDAIMLGLDKKNLIRSLLPAFDSFHKKWIETEASLASIRNELAAAPKTNQAAAPQHGSAGKKD